MKIRANLVYVRDHDLGHGEKGIQKIFQFQTPGGSDVRFTLLTHTGEHEGGPVPTVRHRLNRDGTCETLPAEEMAKHIAGGGKFTTVNPEHKEMSYQEIVFRGDEGKEYEIEIRPVTPAAK